MKLIYRGQSYDNNPDRSGNIGRPARSPHLSQAPYTVIYRGQTLRIDPTNTVDVEQLPSRELIYRGETYRVNAAGQASTPVRRSTAQIPDTMPRHYIGKVHQANLQENLQRRLKAAQERGDRQLVALLEAERQQLAI
jgi:Domain of unknown function (DUF4278)